MSFYDKLKFDANGLIPAIIQEQKTGRVLMMAWMNRASLEKTLETRQDPLLEPVAPEVLDERRIQRPHPDRQGRRVRLRRGHAPDPGGADRRRLPRGLPVLLLPLGEGDGASFKITEAQLKTPGQIYGKK